ncbi:MAG: VCBS repeat-containing protein, partial [Pirellulaceae bacterium]|nr:VCBS repeat-containing protein [Pirellulaceae bacterium]
DDGTLRFTDMTEAAGIGLRRWATSATAADFDGDGDSDLYITCIGDDVLLLNEGGSFTDGTAAAGIAVPGWSTSAAPGDIDGDGDLDLYITRYIDWDFDAPPPPPVTFRGQQVIAGPAGMKPQADVLLLNRGDGTFDRPDATASIPPAYGLNAVMLDVDGDGQLEVLVGNDGMSNQVLERSDGTPLRLRDVGRERGFATNMSGA